MRYSDLGVCAFMYAVCALFLTLALQLPAEAQTYPLCLLAGLGVLNTLFLGRILLQGRGSLVNDLPQIFAGFLPRQFFGVLLACMACVALMPFFGFYAVGIAFLVGVMLFLRVSLPHLLLTVGVLGALVYAVFTLFLKVPLPAGSILG